MGREFSGCDLPGVICEPSLEIPQRFIAGLSQRWSPEYRVEIQVSTIQNYSLASYIINAFIILAKTTFNRRFCLRSVSQFGSTCVYYSPLTRKA